MKTTEVITSALTERRLISFEYASAEGDEDMVRVVEPYLYGTMHNGAQALCAWWVDGYSASENKPHWRLYLVSKMHNVMACNAHFVPEREGYNPEDKRMSEIHWRVK